jgi:TrmH family RNA methyltransferase
VVTERITSASNPRVKAFAKLHKARERARTRLFLIEGHREIARAQAAGVAVETLLVCPGLLTDEARSLADGFEADRSLELDEAPFRKVAFRENPPGLIGVARQFDITISSLRLGDSPLVLIVERVEKPGNLGAMMRTADAVGVDAVVVADAATDVFNPNVVRASQGSLFAVPLAVTTTAEAIAWTQQLSIHVVGGYPAAPNELWQAKMTGPLAVLVGAEDVGISAAWDGFAEPVRIPMAGAADSLNASVAAAILLFEAARQRRAG